MCDSGERGRPLLVEVEGTLTDLDEHCLREVRRLADQQGVPLENMAILYLRGDAIHRLRTRLTHLDIPHRVLGGGSAGASRGCPLPGRPADLSAEPLGPVGVPHCRRSRLPERPAPSQRRGLPPAAGQLAVDQNTDLIQAAELNLDGL